MTAINPSSELPEGWCVRVEPTNLDLITVTITDQLEQERISGFVKAKDRTARTVRQIRYIPDAAIRDRVRDLLHRHLTDRAAILTNLRAVAAELPDFQALTDRLTDAAPGTEVTFGATQSGSTELTLTLTAPGVVASGTVLALFADWLRAEGHTGRYAPEGVTVDLHDQTLTISIAQHHGVRFLSWYRDHHATS